MGDTVSAGSDIRDQPVVTARLRHVGDTLEDMGTVWAAGDPGGSLSSLIADVPPGQLAFWAGAVVVALILVRLLMRAVRKIVGVLMIIAVLVVLGGGGFGYLTGIIG